MVLDKAGQPLKLVNLPEPGPKYGEVMLRVETCGVCRTDLHIVDGDLKNPALPLVPGHQIVGIVEKLGYGVGRFELGQRVGVPWLGSTCGNCRFCLEEQENLCDYPVFTGYNKNGGYAEYVTADEDFCFNLPEEITDIQAAPLLCAGLIGFRAYRMTGRARHLGLYGFGAAAHIIAQIAHFDGREVFAFTRPGDEEGLKFARRLGVSWAGSSLEQPPEPLGAAIIFAPVGALVPLALRAVRKGGVVVCAGIHMSDIPSFAYQDLWQERVLRSVANLTRRDGIDFLELAPKVQVRSHITVYELEEANEALRDMREGSLKGSAVLKI